MLQYEADYGTLMELVQYMKSQLRCRHDRHWLADNIVTAAT